jgi:hypothetical protein
LHPTYARFVYCLGYGEPTFAGPWSPARAGTPQYWKLLASCVQSASPDAFGPVLKTVNRSFDDRLRAKVALLERLRALGVWLVDASAIALCAPGGTRLHGPAYGQVLQCCWRTYTGELIRLAAPRAVVVIGRGVHAALHAELAALRGVDVSCVPQPQACRARGTIDPVYAALNRVCREAASARGARHGQAST